MRDNKMKFKKISLTPLTSPTKKSVVQDALAHKEIPKQNFDFKFDDDIDLYKEQNKNEKRFFMTQNFSKIKFQARQSTSKFMGARAKSEANILKDLFKDDEENAQKSLKKQDSYMFLDMMLKNNFMQGNFKDQYVGSPEDQKYLQRQKQTEFIIRNYSSDIPVLPKPLILMDQLLKDKEKSYRNQNLEININGYGLSDMHAPFLVKTLKQKPIKSVEIGNNNFKDKGIEMILRELINYDTQSLNLSFNTFTYRIMDCFQNVLSQEYSLKDLNLEGNKLGDAAIEKISKYALHLEVLNIANNSITNQGAIYINRMLKSKTRLRELNLHWNRINGIGGKLIADALYQNEYLKVLDISYNSMGIGDQECANYWAKMMSKDSRSGLIHLDLSNNRFDYQSCKVIQAEFKTNNTIYGFHFKGNCGEIDCLGYLVNIDSNYQKKQEEQQQQPTFKRIKAVNILDFLKIMNQQIQINSNEEKGSFGAMENCWICEGWQEKEFIWNPVFSGPVELPPVFIHFNFDGYKPHQMKYINFNGRKYFSLFQMVPPNKKILYFFTAAGNQLHAKDQQWTIKEITIKIQFADQEKACFMTKLNFLKSTVCKQFYDSDYNMMIGVVPRRQELEAYLPKQQELNFQWSLSNSIFEEQLRNNKSFFDQCFEFDWRWGVRLNRVVRELDQLDKVKAFFKLHYEKIISVYKYYASYLPNGELFCWNQQTYQEFVVDAGFVDGRYFKQKDSLLCFIQSNNLAETKTHPQQFNEIQLMLNPENCLIRYQLIEIFTLISIEKYVKTGLCLTLIDAVETLFKHGLGSLIDNIPSCKEWRETKLYTEKCDNILRLYHQLFQQLFNKYSKRRDPKDVMGLFDFKAFLNDYKLTEIDDKTINIIFNMSIPLQIDEMNKQTHLQMDLTQFIESLARLADYFSIIPFKQDKDPFWTKEKCENNPLHIKLESFIQKIIKNSQNTSFQKEFDYQDNSLFFEDFESLKYGKEILEKTRKMIQKKVVGTISTLLMMRGKKEKDKIYSLTNQVPSSFSISNQQNQDQNLQHKTSISSQLNSLSKKQHNDSLLKNQNSQLKTESSNDDNSDNQSQINKSRNKDNSLNLSSSSKIQIEDQNKSETEGYLQTGQNKKQRRSIFGQQNLVLGRGSSIHSIKGTLTPLNNVEDIFSLTNMDSMSINPSQMQSPTQYAQSANFISSPISSSMKLQNNLSPNQIGSQSNIEMSDQQDLLLSSASTAIHSSKKQKFFKSKNNQTGVTPVIKIFNQSNSQEEKPSAKNASTTTSQPKRIHFFPKKIQYDINEIKKSVFSTSSSMNLISPRTLISSTNTLSPQKSNQKQIKLSKQNQKK